MSGRHIYIRMHDNDTPISGRRTYIRKDDDGAPILGKMTMTHLLRCICDQTQSGNQSGAVSVKVAHEGDDVEPLREPRDPPNREQELVSTSHR